MNIIAPYSSHKKTNMIIFIAVLLVAGAWFAYDGYMSKDFIDKHTNDAGEMDSTLTFNKQSPPYFLAGAIAIGIYFLVIRGKKIVLDDEKIVGCGKSIKLSQIEKIDKTNFKSKGHFTITCKDDSGNSINWKLSDSTYDNLPSVLDEIIKKIS